MIDALAALRMQLEWGADEAIGEVPVDRFAPAPALLRPRADPSAPPPRLAPVSAAPTAATLEALGAELAAFEGCPLRTTATHTVRPDGNPAAPIVVIGEAPGSDDDRSGRAFSGTTGALLDRVFGSAGLDRSVLLLTHLVPWRPPGNRRLAEAEIQACLPFLRRLLAIVQPGHLVLLGAAPVRALIGASESARRLRGRWLPVPIEGRQLTMEALALPPPEQWFRNAATKQELWADLIRLRRTLSST